MRHVARGRPRAPFGPLPVLGRGAGRVRDYRRVVQLDGRLSAQHVPTCRVRPAAPVPHAHRHRTLVGHVQVQHHGTVRPSGPLVVVHGFPAAGTLFADCVVVVVHATAVVAVVARQQPGTAVPGPGRRKERVVILRVHRHGLAAQRVRTEQRPVPAARRL